MKLRNTFLEGRMNKDVDERLLPKGQHRDALNVRVSNSEGSNVGAIENSLSNKVLTSFTLGDNPLTIGGYSDEFQEKIYWFVKSDDGSYLLEWDDINEVGTIVLQDTRVGDANVLNLNENYKITGIGMVIDSTDEATRYLCWTDDLNPVRMINIERAKTYGENGFNDFDISLIKQPPKYAPDIALTFTDSTLENNIEDKFLRFAYRYKYLDGEYSALSSFTNPAFSPAEFDLDYQTLENNGMVNSFNAVDITFDTGSDIVTDVQLVFREPQSNNVYIIETFNKEDEGWGNDENRTFEFSNSKTPIILPEDQLFRLYDNVPIRAKALEIINNRLILGNYVEGYNLIDVNDNEVNLDLSVELNTTDLSEEEVTLTHATLNVTDDVMELDLTGIDLDEDTRLTFDVSLEQSTIDGSYDNSFEFILNRDFADADDLATDDDFILFVESVMTNHFLANYQADTPPADSVLNSNTTFEIIGSTSTTIEIQAPSLEYEIDNTPLDTEDSDFTYTTYFWSYDTVNNKVYYRDIAIASSCKTNRSYEVALEYLDEFSRSTPALTDATNTLYIPQTYSVNQNKLRVILNNLPPTQLERFKFLVKPNKSDYQTVYGSIFYEDGLYRWVKLEGANKDKVSEGDTLIVKSDLDGVVPEIIKVRVLEISNQTRDFLEDNVDANDQDITEESGLYMKIKPINFNMDYASNTFLNYREYTAVRSGKPKVYLGSDSSLAGYYDSDTAQYEDYAINAGSRIKVRFRNYESDGYNALYEKEFVVQDSYDNFQDWWEAEVVDLGSLEPQFDWQFIRRPNNSLWLEVEGQQSGATFERSKLSCRIDIQLVDGVLIFETEPDENTSDIFYETAQTFDISSDIHEGNVQNQELGDLTSGTLTIGKIYTITDFNAGDDFTNVGASANESGISFTATGTTPATWSNGSTLNVPAVIDLDFFNCYVQGNGAESYRYKDAFNKNYLSIETRPKLASVDKVKEIRRYADLTYSEVFNENTNVNGLNEFNLYNVNYKEDLDKQYGYIKRLVTRDTNLVIMQEDKISFVLYGKDVLTNADGTENLTTTEDVLGQQKVYTGEFGISDNPESFGRYGNWIFFTDSKRGVVLRLSNDGLFEISNYGMTDWFRDGFRRNHSSTKLGCFDPYTKQYVVNFSQNGEDYTLTYDQESKGWTSFWSFVPDWMMKLNNNFFTVKNGQLYLHNDDENSEYNNFYGVSYPSTITFVFNDEPQHIKGFKTLNLEGNSAWSAELTTDLTNGNILSTEFVEKEGEWYAYTRRTENDADRTSLSTQGLGTLQSFTPNVLTLTGNINSSFNIGDVLYKLNTVSGELELIGTSISKDETLRQITVDSITNLPVANDFIVAVKNSRIESSLLRGYYMEVKLTNDNTSFAELFGVNSDILRSFE